MLSGESGQNGVDIPEVNLKHRALSERMLHRSGLEAAVPLTQHDLLPFRMLQVDEFLLVASEGDFRTDDVRPKSEAGIQVDDMKLGYDVGPAGSWRRLSIETHIDNVLIGGMAT